MARFCSDECREMGSICDFCKHYKDEYRDIKKLKHSDGRFKFAGEGICDIDNHGTDADAGYNCNNFVCFLLQDPPIILFEKENAYES
jgi:hypothetical protein